MVLPDTHVSEKLSADTDFLTAAMDVIVDVIRPSFVIHTGDMIDLAQGIEPAPPARVRNMWDRFDKLVLNRLRKRGIPFFPVAGNHDVAGALNLYWARWSKFKNRGVAVSGPDGYVGAYSFDWGGAHVAVIYAPGSIVLPRRRQQLTWLKHDLERARARGARPILVFSHSPLFCPQLDTRCHKDRAWLRGPDLLAVLRDAQAVHIGGHMHVFHDVVWKGVRSIISGMLGGGFRTIHKSGTPQPEQFLVIVVADGKIRLHRVESPEFSVSRLPACR
ncbi:MAG: metallophosphoesterase [bacterium]